QQTLHVEPSAERFGEFRDVVNSLAVKYSLAEQILVNVGDGPAVRIDAGAIGEDPRKTGGSGAGQCDADARLDNRVATPAIASFRIELHAVQRMRDGFDQSASGSEGKLRIGVERQNIANGHR